MKRTLSCTLALGLMMSVATPTTDNAVAADAAVAQTPVTQMPVAQTPAVEQTDETLKDRIAFRLETSSVVRTYDVKVKVEDGVAMLSGEVATAAQKAEAERIAKIDGITRVESTIEVDADVDKTINQRIKGGFSKTGEKISDGWITAKINWFFVGEDRLKGSRIDVDTKDNVVTLKGTVASQAGRLRAVELAKSADGVKRVVDQLTVSTSEQ